MGRPVLGGIVICRPSPIIVKSGDRLGFTFMSDHHIGSANTDYKLIEAEIKAALGHGDRILLNGDLLDLVLVKDHKRFDPDALHPRLRGRRNIVNEAIAWAVELLSPAAHLIDMIGVGNHETFIERFHNFDPTQVIVYELEKLARKKVHNHVIHYGGYTGFVDYRMRFSRVTERTSAGGARWVIYYHHGSGSAAPVTKGMIDFNRKDTWVDADLIWMGHKHNRWNANVIKLSCPQNGDQPNVKDVRHLMTGAYFDTYVGQSQKSIRKRGRRSNYAADLGLAPQGKGGARVMLDIDGHRRTYEVKVMQ